MTDADRAKPNMLDITEAGTAIVAWTKHHHGASAEAANVSRMSGHSGITYTFDVIHDGTQAGLVLRVPPPGVRQQHNLDMLRLIPVLGLTAGAGVPVPTVQSDGEDQQWFGSPYLMVNRIAGATLPDVFETDAGALPAPVTVEQLFRQATEALASIHDTDISSLVASQWTEPASVEDDIDHWIPMLHKSEVPQEIKNTLELRDRLLATAPRDETVTLVHGDYYSNNWLFDGGRLTAVLDWENTTLNRPMWDLGWMATIYDPRCWAPERATTMGWNPTPSSLYTWYAEVATREVRDPDWYQALMCYRLASITPAKVRLHRTGRRVDPIWELFAASIPYQLDTAFALLSGQCQTRSQ